MKGNSLFSKYILFILGIISLMPGMAYSQTFKHYQGIANKTGDYEVIDAATECLRQKTHVFHYYIALPSGGSKELSLPLAGYSGDGADLEPRGYFRWYNYVPTFYEFPFRLILFVQRNRPLVLCLYFQSGNN